MELDSQAFTPGPCPGCRGLMREIVSLNHVVDTLQSRLDLSISDMMVEAHKKSSFLQQRDANRDAHEADLRVELVESRRQSSQLALRVKELEAAIAASHCREERLQRDLDDMEKQIGVGSEPSEVMCSWTQTDRMDDNIGKNNHKSLSPPARRSLIPLHHSDGTSTQGDSPSHRTVSASSSRSTARTGSVVVLGPGTNVPIRASLASNGEASPSASRPRCSVTRESERSASPTPPMPTPRHHVNLSRLLGTKLLDGVACSDLAWPDLSEDDEVEEGNVRSTMSLPSVVSSTTSMGNIGYTPRFGKSRCTTPRSGKHTQGRRPTVYSQWSSTTAVPRGYFPECSSPCLPADTPEGNFPRTARTPSFPRTVEQHVVAGGRQHVRSCRRQPIHQETAELFRTALDGLHMFRGLTVRADSNMLRTMTTMHERRDTGCPLKQALTSVKQILLGAMPSLASRIRDGEQWQVRKRDLQSLQLEHTSGIANSLRSLMVAHDYLRGQDRGQAMPSLVELYLNIHVFILLARAPTIQRHFSL